VVVIPRSQLWIPLVVAALACGACAKKGTKAGNATVLEARFEIVGQRPPPVVMCPDALAPFDELVSGFIAKHHVPGASLAVIRDDRLVCAKGYGFADRVKQVPVLPSSTFRIASISKPITATAIMKLVERGELSLDARVFQLLDLKRFVSKKLPIDPRLTRVTVRDLLRHSGGFDRDVSFDPMFSPRKIAKALGITSPPGPWEIIRYMTRRRLDFDPGTKHVYSNFGYLLLGRIVEKVTGATYEQWVRDRVFAPIGVTGVRIGRTAEKHLRPGEVHYYDGRGLEVRSVLGNTKSKVPRPYGLWYLESMDAHGGWVTSAVDLARFSAAFAKPEESPLLTADSIEQMFTPPPFVPVDEHGRAKDSFYGLGWRVRHKSQGRANVWHNGNLEGTSTTMVRRYDGTAWVVLFNTDRTKDGTPLTKLIDGDLHQAAAAVTDWPEHDLFVHFD